MTGPRISVALCTHNGERYVGEQAASILAQTRRVAEVVVSDDASSDATLERASRALRGNGGPEVVAIENPEPLGVTRNFAQALDRVRGEYIALCDQDDVWHADKVERLTSALDAGALLAFSDARLVDGSGQPLGRTLFQDLELSAAERESVEAGRAFDALLRRNLATGATVMLRRELLEAAAPIPDEWVHDEWLAIIAAAVGRVAIVDEPTIDYRLHGANQIGVRAPTLLYKIRRVLEPRGERNALLAVKFEVLARRLRAMGEVLPAGLVERAERKAAFERTRAALPAGRLRRLPTVLALFRSGDYGAFASQGRRDVVRDLLQSHRVQR